MRRVYMTSFPKKFPKKFQKNFSTTSGISPNSYQIRMQNKNVSQRHNMKSLSKLFCGFKTIIVCSKFSFCVPTKRFSIRIRKQPQNHILPETNKIRKTDTYNMDDVICGYSFIVALSVNSTDITAGIN